MEIKKKWSKPKLVILARANPEEMVLALCKGGAQKQPHTTGQNYCISTTYRTCPDSYKS